MISILKNLFLLMLVLITLPALAAEDTSPIPMGGIAIRIIPRNINTNDGLGIKTILIRLDRGGQIVSTWTSMSKELVSMDPFPHFKIRAGKGVIHVDGLAGKTGLFHPALWGKGYYRPRSRLPLWLDPAYLELKGKNYKSFDVGFVTADKIVLQSAPDMHFEKISFFQNLYKHYIVNGQIKSSDKLKKTDKRELTKFIHGFFRVRRLAKTKADVVVNKSRKIYPAKIIGNEYYQMVVIDDPLNPLIVSFKISTHKIPRVFQKVFKYFKKHFEYLVTQVNY